MKKLEQHKHKLLNLVFTLTALHSVLSDIYILTRNFNSQINFKQNHQTYKMSAPAAAPVKKVVKAKKPAVPAAHPKYSVMIAAAITTLKDRTGSSRQAILKYVCANYKVDAAKAAVQVRLALKKGLAAGTLKHAKATPGKGAGSFKIGEKAKVEKKKVVKKPKAKKPAAKKAKKPAAKKAAKKPAAKKATKKPAAKKAAKKPAAKKPAAKKPAAKKPAAKKPAAKKAAAKK